MRYCSLSFFVISLSGFGIRVLLASYNELGTGTKLQFFFGRDCIELVLILSLMLVELTSDAIWAWSLLV